MPIQLRGEGQLIGVISVSLDLCIPNPCRSSLGFYSVLWGMSASLRKTIKCGFYICISNPHFMNCGLELCSRQPRRPREVCGRGAPSVDSCSGLTSSRGVWTWHGHPRPSVDSCGGFARCIVAVIFFIDHIPKGTHSMTAARQSREERRGQAQGLRPEHPRRRCVRRRQGTVSNPHH